MAPSSTTVAVLLEEGSQVNELREKICGALNMNLEGKLYFYNTKKDKTTYVTLNDNNGVAMLFHLNEGDVDLFVEDTGQNNDLIPTFYNLTRESMVTDNISSLGGILALHSSSQAVRSNNRVHNGPWKLNEVVSWYVLNAKGKGFGSLVKKSSSLDLDEPEGLLD
ncbi:hypothetical protein RHSIM_Rhsim02G0093700 [Rhododendron simsii]|uniref:Uncharacterized protein n=1 Tax=Rhododendron simsii TaxID=118357 RepID=A0A834HC08_RHOSS|nr:hypothetical protein RHSIM_Rhsim02G0093700 [Rhododendron simsii]